MLQKLRQIYASAMARPPIHKAELLCVQRMRGIAVLMVLVVHLEDVAMRLPHWVQSHSFFSQRIGYSGPDMFFVISGFIMTYITLGAPFRPRQWLVSRFIRIYPMYILFTLMVAMLWLHNPAMTMGSGPQTMSTVLQSTFILPQAGLPLLFVGWTVEHEIVFYAIVFLTAWLLRPHWLPGVLWGLSALAIVRWLYQQATDTQIWDLHLTSLYMIQFAMGASVYRYWMAHPRNHWFGPGCIAVALFLAGVLLAESGSINQEQPLRVLAFGGAYSMLLLALLNVERAQKAAGRFATRRDPLVWMGDASYAIYLSHPFVLGSFGKLFPHLESTPTANVLYVGLAAAATLGVGLLTHVLLEKPIIEMGKLLSGRRSSITPPSKSHDHPIHRNTP